MLAEQDPVAKPKAKKATVTMAGSDVAQSKATTELSSDLQAPLVVCTPAPPTIKCKINESGRLGEIALLKDLDVIPAFTPGCSKPPELQQWRSLTLASAASGAHMPVAHPLRHIVCF